MKWFLAAVVVLDLCILARVPGEVGVVACWLLAIPAVWVHYRFCRATGHVPGHTCRCHSRRCRGRC